MTNQKITANDIKSFKKNGATEKQLILYNVDSLKDLARSIEGVTLTTNSRPKRKTVLINDIIKALPKKGDRPKAKSSLDEIRKNIAVETAARVEAVIGKMKSESPAASPSPSVRSSVSSSPSPSSRSSVSSRSNTSSKIIDSRLLSTKELIHRILNGKESDKEPDSDFVRQSETEEEKRDRKTKEEEDITRLAKNKSFPKSPVQSPLRARVNLSLKEKQDSILGGNSSEPQNDEDEWQEMLDGLVVKAAETPLTDYDIANLKTSPKKLILAEAAQAKRLADEAETKRLVDEDSDSDSESESDSGVSVVSSVEDPDDISATSSDDDVPNDVSVVSSDEDPDDISAISSVDDTTVDYNARKISPTEKEDMLVNMIAEDSQRPGFGDTTEKGYGSDVWISRGLNLLSKRIKDKEISIEDAIIAVSKLRFERQTQYIKTVLDSGLTSDTYDDRLIFDALVRRFSRRPAFIGKLVNDIVNAGYNRSVLKNTRVQTQVIDIYKSIIKDDTNSTEVQVGALNQLKLTSSVVNNGKYDTTVNNVLQPSDEIEYIQQITLQLFRNYRNNGGDLNAIVDLQSIHAGNPDTRRYLSSAVQLEIIEHMDKDDFNADMFNAEIIKTLVTSYYKPRTDDKFSKIMKDNIAQILDHYLNVKGYTKDSMAVLTSDIGKWVLNHVKEIVLMNYEKSPDDFLARRQLRLLKMSELRIQVVGTETLTKDDYKGSTHAKFLAMTKKSIMDTFDEREKLITTGGDKIQNKRSEFKKRFGDSDTIWDIKRESDAYIVPKKTFAPEGHY